MDIIQNIWEHDLGGSTMTKNMESKFGGPRIEKIMASIIKKKKG